jgi:hypothetical protein
MPHLSILTDNPGLSMTRGGDRLRATSLADLIHVALVDVEEDGSAGQGGGGLMERLPRRGVTSMVQGQICTWVYTSMLLMQKGMFHMTWNGGIGTGWHTIMPI